MDTLTKTPCKICNGELEILAHTATCQNCGALLCYPYPQSDDELYISGIGRQENYTLERIKELKLGWHIKSKGRSHAVMTEAANFALCNEDRTRPIKVLDYGAGGGQFALVINSIHPLAEVFCVDISDCKLLDQYRPLNNQIKFDDFSADTNQFDYIFMNDVYEHVSDPARVLSDMSNRLKKGGKIFIDTPRQFWIYPVTKFLNRKLHIKVLKGTVDSDHQQIWSSKSFLHTVNKAGLRIEKLEKASSLTQSADFYMKNMGVTNGAIVLCGRIFYRFAKIIAKNKYMAVLGKS